MKRDELQKELERIHAYINWMAKKPEIIREQKDVDLIVIAMNSRTAIIKELTELDEKEMNEIG